MLTPPPVVLAGYHYLGIITYLVLCLTKSSGRDSCGALLGCWPLAPGHGRPAGGWMCRCEGAGAQWDPLASDPHPEPWGQVPGLLTPTLAPPHHTARKLPAFAAVVTPVPSPPCSHCLLPRSVVVLILGWAWDPLREASSPGRCSWEAFSVRSQKAHFPACHGSAGSVRAAPAERGLPRASACPTPWFL